jgi:hypothetical protein
MGATAAVSDAGRDLFLAGVERALQPLDDPAEIMATVARFVGERLTSSTPRARRGRDDGARRHPLHRGRRLPAALRYKVPAHEILARCGERELVGGQEDMIIDIALELAGERSAG